MTEPRENRITVMKRVEIMATTGREAIPMNKSITFSAGNFFRKLCGFASKSQLLIAT